jgi:RNA-directed DNA polymerase
LEKKFPLRKKADDDPYRFDKGKPVLPKVSQLRRKLAEKAKREPKFRFYVLYDRIYRQDVLWSAWCLVQRNDGGPGIDKQTIEEVEQYGAIRLIDEIHETLKSKTYQPQPIKRVHIPKGDGKTRPLGIPTVKDRIIQQACLLILEPIFEEDFLDCSYGYRPGRSAHQALDVIERNLKEGRTAVYDADLKGYFDSIPHDKLMKTVEFRIADRQVLSLIRMWLTAPIIDKDEQGRTTKKRPDRGTPQGGVISPLLANLYLHWFDKVFHGKDGPFKFANARMVRFADDFVIMAKVVTNELTEWIEQKIEEWMGLRINREKTKTVYARIPGTTLNFLGYSFRYDKYPKMRWRHFVRMPSKKSMQRARDRIRELTSTRRGCLPIDEVVRQLNWFLIGWSNYYSTGESKPSFHHLNRFVQNRMYQFLRRRSQRSLNLSDGMGWYDLIYKVLMVRYLK